MAAAVVTAIGAGAGAISDGVAAYKNGGDFGDVAKAAGEGALAGGAGAFTGLATTFLTDNPALGGAAGAAMNDLVKSAFSGHFCPLEFTSDVAFGGAFGPLSEAMGPEVRGGQNFNPFTSPRVWGPKAQQAYWQEGLGDLMGVDKDAAKNMGGRKDKGGDGSCE